MCECVSVVPPPGLRCFLAPGGKKNPGGLLVGMGGGSHFTRASHRTVRYPKAEVVDAFLPPPLAYPPTRSYRMRTLSRACPSHGAPCPTAVRRARRGSRAPGARPPALATLVRIIPCPLCAPRGEVTLGILTCVTHRQMVHLDLCLRTLPTPHSFGCPRDGWKQREEGENARWWFLVDSFFTPPMPGQGSCWGPLA